MPNVGDFVKIPWGTSGSNYLIGTVVELQSHDTFVKVELIAVNEGEKFATVPRYLAKKITGREFIAATRKTDNAYQEVEPKECRHEWIKTGSSPIFGDDWYNCKFCNIAKEKV